MSCVSFLSDNQRAALRSSAGERITPEESQALHPPPPVTEGKLRRIRALARSDDPRIRESAALNAHCPPDVLAELAQDAQIGVRGCVARTPGAPGEVLAELANDPIPQVRAWVASNPNVSVDLLSRLAEDSDPTVRQVVSWARDWPRT
ncbi:hypothetical protein [Demetria terragena]|uniref:variant leucine-rich repeat-containing protein n=1 Tax=Demetria terragena TaxID=63959 RepID=UPI00036A1485|nr:hypothetical protein [Demetria terragena]